MRGVKGQKSAQKMSQIFWMAPPSNTWSQSRGQKRNFVRALSEQMLRGIVLRLTKKHLNLCFVSRLNKEFVRNTSSCLMKITVTAHSFDFFHSRLIFLIESDFQKLQKEKLCFEDMPCISLAELELLGRFLKNVLQGSISPEQIIVLKIL